MSGYVELQNQESHLYQLIWDLSDVSELIDFSAITSAYIDPHSNKALDPHIIPKLLGALSHDWVELQIADILSNFALDHIAEKRGYPDADKEKGAAFEKHLYPLLMRSQRGTDGIGWKLLF
jgi:hypothetical protein